LGDQGVRLWNIKGNWRPFHMGERVSFEPGHVGVERRARHVVDNLGPVVATDVADESVGRAW
jgi:hypothetical protein